ncbi:hypothetical protein B5M09_003664 [Aphanomyces astaci]|uniref:Heterogeneous nuclear ribonucleoprotein Q acidic domain-containing protein n=1 Tax=Aphanomyces astaci TaxID=112090 RepID=A0A425DCE8_APHAT|nr:hypothetical protein B5M09_003664 [Aphanomyces astaci]
MDGTHPQGEVELAHGVEFEAAAQGEVGPVNDDAGQVSPTEPAFEAVVPHDDAAPPSTEFSREDDVVDDTSTDHDPLAIVPESTTTASDMDPFEPVTSDSDNHHEDEPHHGETTTTASSTGSAGDAFGPSVVGGTSPSVSSAEAIDAWSTTASEGADGPPSLLLLDDTDEGHPDVKAPDSDQILPVATLLAQGQGDGPLNAVDAVDLRPAAAGQPDDDVSKTLQVDNQSIREHNDVSIDHAVLPAPQSQQLAHSDGSVGGGLSDVVWTRLLDFEHTPSAEFTLSQLHPSTLDIIATFPEFGQLAIVSRFTRAAAAPSVARNKDALLLQILQEYEQEQPAVRQLAVLSAVESAQPSTGMVANPPRRAYNLVAELQQHKAKFLLDEFGRVKTTAAATSTNRVSVPHVRSSGSHTPSYPDGRNQPSYHVGGGPARGGGRSRSPVRRPPQDRSRSRSRDRRRPFAPHQPPPHHDDVRYQERYQAHQLAPPMTSPYQQQQAPYQQQQQRRPFGSSATQYLVDEFRRSEVYHRLAPSIRDALQALYAKGHVRELLNDSVLSRLVKLPEHLAVRAVENLGNTDASHVDNIHGFFVGIISRVYERDRGPPPAASGMMQPPLGDDRYSDYSSSAPRLRESMPPPQNHSRGQQQWSQSPVHDQLIRGLSPQVQAQLQHMAATGVMTAVDEWGEKCYEILAQLSESLAIEVLKRFTMANLDTVRNRSGFLIGVVKRCRQEYGLQP